MVRELMGESCDRGEGGGFSKFFLLYAKRGNKRKTSAIVAGQRHGANAAFAWIYYEEGRRLI